MIGPQANHWKLGLFVLSGALLVFFAVIWFGAARFDRRMIEAVTYIDESVQGLDAGAPVKFRGVPIGRVRDITFAPDRRHVELRLEIFEDVLTRLGLRERGGAGGLAFAEQGWRVRLTRSGITGITFLEADVFDGPRAPLPDFAGDVPRNVIPATPSLLKGLEDGLNEALREVPDLIRNTNHLVRGVGAEFEDLELGRRLAEALGTWTRLAEALEARTRAFDPDTLSAAIADVARASAALAVLGERLGEEEGEFLLFLAEARGAMEAAGRGFERLDQGLEAFDPEATGAALRRAVDGLALLTAEGAFAVERTRADWPQVLAALEALRALAQLLEREPSALLRGRHEPR